MTRAVRALSLAERVQGGPPSSAIPGTEVIEAEWRRWRQAPWFAGDPEKWVNSRGFDLTDFKIAVAAGLLDDPATTRPTVTAGRPDPDDDRSPTFDVLVVPLVDEAMARFVTVVTDELAGSAYAPDPEAIWAICRRLADGLRLRLLSFIQRAVVLEVNIARVRGELSGETSQQRLTAFLRRLRLDEHSTAFWADYPVLRRLCEDEPGRWHDSLRTMLSRLRKTAADGDTLRLANRGPLTSIVGPLGDAHRGGQAVWAIRFADGGTVAYKPRSMATEVCFAAFVRWLNKRPDCPGLFQPLVLDRGDWGLQEWVTAQPCPPTDLPAFYRRFGWSLAAAHALKITDLHCENVIAAGAHPVPIDLETLAHPNPDRPMVSVLSTGLLPNYSWALLGADISALTGGLAGTSTTIEVPGYTAVGTDEIRLVRQPGELPPGQSRPVTDPAHRPADFLDDLLGGFRAGYRACREASDRSVAGQALSGLSDLSVRYVPRSTQVYASALLESLHPNLLTDAAERELYLSHLWAATRERPSLARLTDSEIRDLTTMDVPVFTTAAGSRDLVDGRGRRLPDYFTETVAEGVGTRLATLTERDLDRQTHAVALAVRATVPASEATIRTRSPHPAGSAAEAAGGIAARLAELAHPSDRGPQWIGLSSLGEDGQGVERWCAGPVGDWLYDGRAGIALFLTSAGLTLREPGLVSLASETWQALATGAETTLPRTRPISTGPGSVEAQSPGAFDGRAGLAYALAWAGSTLDEPRWVHAAAGLVDVLHAELADDTIFDVAGGAAGIALVAAELATVPGLAAYERLAVDAADHLTRHARTADTGVYWPAADSSRGGFTGFTHGAAGIAAALSRVAAQSGRTRFEAVAEAAIAWEDAQRDPDTLDWPDYRTATTDAGPPRTRGARPMVAWCHGAAGVGLGRALARQPDIAAIRHARDRVLARTGTRGHGLCHGHLGNHAILSRLDRADPDGAAVAARDTLRQECLDAGAADGWLTGHPASGATPGLLTGLAGIGYGLLLADGSRHTPSVLSLELNL